MSAVEQALEQANACQNDTWQLEHYRAEAGVPPKSRWFWDFRPLTNNLVLCGKQPAIRGEICYDMVTTGYLQFLSPSYVRLPHGFLDGHFVLGKAGDEGMPEISLLAPGSDAVLIRTREATFCIVCKDVVFTRDEQRTSTVLPKGQEAVNAALDQFDGATLEWWGYADIFWRCAWKVTGLPWGAGYIRMQATRYMNFPQVMRNVHLRVATDAETEDLLRQLGPLACERLRPDAYLMVECQEGLFSVWAEDITVVWEEAKTSSMLR